MSKKIYITEEIAEQITANSQPISELPQDIRNVLRNHKTSLGTHPAFPEEEDIPFDMMITRVRFEEVLINIKKLDLVNYSREAVNDELKDTIEKCKEIEKNFKEQLENLCYNFIIDLFHVPEGLVNFKCSLVDKVDDVQAPTHNDNETMTFENIPERDKLIRGVYKRRIINALITGGAIRLSYINKNLVGEVYDLCPELPGLYRKISILNDYLLFTKNNMGISEKKKKQGGISYLVLGNDTTMNKIRAEGEIFPIMLHESIRGFLEMFAAYGLPKRQEECKYILSKADFLEAEPWDMRMGPVLWDKLMSAFGNPDSDKLPMILTILFSQSTKKFNAILQEIFANTRRGERMALKIVAKAEYLLEMDDFEELMAKKQTERSIIADQYFAPEEL